MAVTLRSMMMWRMASSVTRGSRGSEAGCLRAESEKLKE